jgi:hypothetical protein
MNPRMLLLLTFACLSLGLAHTARAVTCLWTNALPVGATITDLTPDGKGGVVVCYASGSAAYVRYIDKNGVQAWNGGFISASEAYADYISKKEVIVVFFVSGKFKAFRVDLKTGNVSIIAGAADEDYTFGPTIPTANKDSKGFFLVRHVVATDERFILRYSYK